VLSVSGNVHHKDVVELAKKYFTDETKFKKTKIKKVRWNSGQKLVHAESENQVTVMMAWPTFGREDSTIKTRTIARLADTILSSGMSSKLFKEIREKRGLVYSVGSYIQHYDDLGYLMIVGGTDHNKIEEYFEATALVLNNFNKDLTDRDLTKAKNDIKASLCMQLENSSNVVMGNIDAMQNYGRPMDLKTQLAAIEEVVLDDIKQFMSNLLSQKSVLSVYGFCPQIDTGAISLEKFEAMLK